MKNKQPRQPRHSQAVEHPQPRKKRELHPEEEALWQQVRKTVQPISSKRQGLKHWLDGEQGDPVPLSTSELETTGLLNSVPGQQLLRSFPTPSYKPPVSKQASFPGLPSTIDDKTARKLVKGKRELDSRLDLHGMTQDRAHRILEDFVFQQYHAGSKIVLVITGKGRAEEGILRNAVPRWLREPLLAQYVSAFRVSHSAHGGEGALYVRLRNKDRFPKRKET